HADVGEHELDARIDQQGLPARLAVGFLAHLEAAADVLDDGRAHHSRVVDDENAGKSVVCVHRHPRLFSHAGSSADADDGAAFDPAVDEVVEGGRQLVERNRARYCGQMARLEVGGQTVPHALPGREADV